MRKGIALMLMVLIPLVPLHARASQKDVLPVDEAKAFASLAAAIPPGSRVRLQTTSGRRLKATLMSVTAEGIVVKRETRLPEPAIAIPFSELADLQLERRGGMSVAKAIGIGLGAGVGAILTMFAIALQID